MMLYYLQVSMLCAATPRRLLACTSFELVLWYISSSKDAADVGRVYRAAARANVLLACHVMLMLAALSHLTMYERL